MSSSLPEAPPPDTITWGWRFSMNFRGTFHPRQVSCGPCRCLLLACTWTTMWAPGRCGWTTSAGLSREVGKIWITSQDGHWQSLQNETELYTREREESENYNHSPSSSASNSALIHEFSLPHSPHSHPHISNSFPSSKICIWIYPPMNIIIQCIMVHRLYVNLFICIWIYFPIYIIL